MIEQWNGYPPDPDKPGTYIVRDLSGKTFGLWWSAIRRVWETPTGPTYEPKQVAEGGFWRYVGPMVNPETHQRLIVALKKIEEMAETPYICFDPDFGNGYDTATESAARTAREALEGI